MMQSYATFDDIKLRYPGISDDDKNRVEALISDASALLDAELKNVGVDVSKADDTLKANLKAVCCAMVIRAMPAFSEDINAPINTFQQTAGPFSQNVTLANPMGDLYLTSSERKRLGITSAAHSIKQVFLSTDILGPSEDSRGI